MGHAAIEQRAQKNQRRASGAAMAATPQGMEFEHATASRRLTFATVRDALRDAALETSAALFVPLRPVLTGLHVVAVPASRAPSVLFGGVLAPLRAVVPVLRVTPAERGRWSGRDGRVLLTLGCEFIRHLWTLATEGVRGKDAIITPASPLPHTPAVRKVPNTSSTVLVV